jgi:hypothetical protein
MTISTSNYTAVNIGSAANDGTGDDLRTAFYKINQNFGNVETIGLSVGNLLAGGGIEAVDVTTSGSLTTSGQKVETGYQINRPTANVRITSQNTKHRLILAPTGTVISFGANVTLPSANVEGSIFSITSNVATVLSVMPSLGTRLSPFGNIVLAAGTEASYLYCIADTTWYKIG